MNNNINLLVLKSFFDFKSVWLSEIEFLKNDYALLASKINQYIKMKNEFPSKAIIKNSIPKFVSGDSVEDEGIRKRLRSIMTAIIENDSEMEYTKSELYDLLIEDNISDKAMTLIQQQGEALLKKDFDKIQRLSDQLLKITKTGSNIVLKDSVDSIIKIKTKDSKISTGFDFGLGTGLEVAPKGSVINIIAGTGFGKSHLALQSMIVNFLYHDKNVCNFNYELSRPEIALRIKSFISRVPVEEIENESYSVSDNAFRVKAVEYVLKRKIDINKATEILVSKKLEDFEKYPLRKNKMIIICAEGEVEYSEGYDGDFEEDELPNDQQLLSYVEKHGNELDCVYIDLITELTFKHPTSSEAGDIKNFVKEFKRLCKKFSIMGFVLNQVQDEQSSYGLLHNKYSKSLAQTSDLVIAIVSLDEMVENNETLLVIKKCRHGQPNQALICSRDFSIGRFTPTGDIIYLSEVIKKLNKQFSKKG